MRGMKLINICSISREVAFLKTMLELPNHIFQIYIIDLFHIGRSEHILFRGYQHLLFL